MTMLWPHLPAVVGTALFEKIARGKECEPGPEHPDQTWAPVGGRVSDRTVRGLIDEVTALAASHGFPTPAGPDARIAFDRDAAKLLHERMDLSWAEAGNRDLWSFVSLVALPHVTRWRFGTDNRERWLATDLTRHTWSRLWWQRSARVT
jgi:hypothetical protein